jgi:hypothetical protein
MRAERTLYEVLQVDRGAEPEVIEAAYRRLARMYHPDVSTRAGADRRMKEINAAYDVLSEPGRRAVYDRELVAVAAEVHMAPAEAEESPGREPDEEGPSSWAMLGCREHSGEVAVGACQECGAGLCSSCFERFQPPWCVACTRSRVSQRRSRVWMAMAWFYGVGGLMALQLVRVLTQEPPAPSWLVALVGCGAYLVASYPSGLAALGGGQALAENPEPLFALGFAAVVGPFVAPFRMIKLGFELRQLGRTEAIARSADS